MSLKDINTTEILLYCKPLQSYSSEVKNMYMKTLYIIFSILLSGCQSSAQEQKTPSKFKIEKTNQEWKNSLSAIEYYILRESGTERAFSGIYNSFYKKGTYICKACETPLFISEHKFDSGTGWPSFDTAIKENIGYDTDNNLGHLRTEIHCNTCGGHLGHVFNDGPKKTTGKRYCVNSTSLIFSTKLDANNK